MNTHARIKYWSWMSAFTLSFLFWLQLVVMLAK